MTNAHNYVTYWINFHDGFCGFWQSTYLYGDRYVWWPTCMVIYLYGDLPVWWPTIPVWYSIYLYGDCDLFSLIVVNNFKSAYILVIGLYFLAKNWSALSNLTVLPYEHMCLGLIRSNDLGLDSDYLEKLQFYSSEVGQYDFDAVLRFIKFVFLLQTIVSGSTKIAVTESLLFAVCLLLLLPRRFLFYIIRKTGIDIQSYHQYSTPMSFKGLAEAV